MESGQSQSSRKRVRDDVELELAEVKRLRDDLLGALDDSEEPDSVSQDLDSVMRSFQEEISAPPTVIDLTSDSGDSPAELGYLLEASDDELGLPPSTAASGDEAAEPVRVRSGPAAGTGELWGFGSFDDQIPSYDDSFGYGDGQYAAAFFDEGLFGFSDGCFDPSEALDFSWRSETMPAQ